MATPNPNPQPLPPVVTGEGEQYKGKDGFGCLDCHGHFMAAAAAVQCHKRNVAVVAVVTSRFLSHLQRLVIVKVRGRGYP